MPTVYLPIVGARPDPIVAASFPCDHNDWAWQLAQLLVNHPDQGRRDMKCMPELTQAAQAKAQHMQDNKYYAHDTPEGVTPNEWVRQHGIRLPGAYPKKGNTVESIAVEHEDPAFVFNAFLNSPGHRAHVLAEKRTFREQRWYGVGFATRQDTDWWSKAWVILTVP